LFEKIALFIIVFLSNLKDFVNEIRGRDVLNRSQLNEDAGVVIGERIMVIERGEIWWANLPAPVASEPGYRRPILIIQSNHY